jgi:hypothetical protein
MMLKSPRNETVELEFETNESKKWDSCIEIAHFLLILNQFARSDKKNRFPEAPESTDDFRLLGYTCRAVRARPWLSLTHSRPELATAV